VAEPKHSPAGSGSTDPDQGLIDGFRRGEARAFDDLVKRHESRVLRLCSRILSDADAALDAAQETFVKAWRAIGSFHGDARFSTWLTRIAINQCRNELRRKKTVKHTAPLSLDSPTGTSGASDAPESILDGIASSDAGPFEVARGREVAAALKVALAEVDVESREVLLLRDAEELSYEEIAEILDVPVGTVRSRLHRARAEVRRRLAPVLSESATRSESSTAPRTVLGARHPDASLPSAPVPDAAP